MMKWEGTKLLILSNVFSKNRLLMVFYMKYISYSKLCDTTVRSFVKPWRDSSKSLQLSLNKVRTVFYIFNLKNVFEFWFCSILERHKTWIVQTDKPIFDNLRVKNHSTVVTSYFCLHKDDKSNNPFIFVDTTRPHASSESHSGSVSSSTFWTVTPGDPSLRPVTTPKVRKDLNNQQKDYSFEIHSYIRFRSISVIPKLNVYRYTF